MDAARQKRLEAIGWKVYDHAGDIFGLTEAEKQEMDFRNALSRAIRKQREKLGLSENDLAKRLKIGKRKARKIEWGDWDISLEEMLSAYSALGGRIGITELPPYSSNGEQNGAKPSKRKARATA